MTKQIKELTTYAEISDALTIGPVFCDITAPAATGLPVRKIRKFKGDGLDESRGLDTKEWTSRHFQGTQKGFEVLVLEGWHVPEKVYIYESTANQS